MDQVTEVRQLRPPRRPVTCQIVPPTGSFHTTRLVLFAALCMMLSSGCSYTDSWLRNGLKVGPNYAKPAAPISDQWIDVNDRRIISESVDEVAWWRTFNDPVINRVVWASYQDNLPLRTAGMRVLEAQAQRGIAVGGLFPQSQQAFGDYQRIQIGKSGNALGIGAFPFRAFDLWGTGASVAWELDVWGKFRRAIESADANVDASIEDYDDVLVCLIAESTAAYVQYRTFEQRLVYAHANVTIQEEYVRIAETRFKNGAVSELDVTEAKSQLAETEALIASLEAGLRQTNNALCVLLGISTRDLKSDLGDGPIPTAASEVVVGIPAELIRRRPDVRRAEREVATQSALIGIAAADLLPAFSINGSINYQASKFSDMFSPAALAGSVGPSFRWNILNYGRIANNIRVQDARFQQRAIEYQQAVLDANAEVEDAIISFLKAQQQHAALRAAVKLTERSVELVRTQYREGDIPFNRVNDRLHDLVLRQDNMATAEAAIALSLIRIYKTLGGGWEIRSGDLTPPEVLGSAPAVPAEGHMPMPNDNDPLPPADRPNENGQPAVDPPAIDPVPNDGPFKDEARRGPMFQFEPHPQRR